MSMKDRISEGEGFEVEQVSRRTGAKVISAFKIDGKTGAVTTNKKPVLAGNPFVAGVTLGSNGAASIVLANAAVGDKVVMLVDLTDATDGSGSFEATISVAGHIAQTSVSDLSAKKFMILLVHQS